MQSRIDENKWIRCGKCGHKLARIEGNPQGGTGMRLELKCHSCKEINTWDASQTSQNAR